MATLEFIPVFVEDCMPDFEDMEPGKVYISTKYNVSIHKCPCGCGEKIVLTINYE